MKTKKKYWTRAFTLGTDMAASKIEKLEGQLVSPVKALFSPKGKGAKDE